MFKKLGSIIVGLQIENYKLKKVLDEIEKVVANNISYMDTVSTTDAMKEVLKLIKQAKEGGEC